MGRKNYTAVNHAVDSRDKKPAEGGKQQQQHIILFYKYHPLSNDKAATEVYREALEILCQSLSLTGRILVAHAETEGINGTLAGDFCDVMAFTYALLGEANALELLASSNKKTEEDSLGERRMGIVEAFWKRSRHFFDSISQPNLEITSPEDFKWSRANTDACLFPDLNVKLVKELIGTGGVMMKIPLEETAHGYLTPQEWHQELTELANVNEDQTTKDDTILIDCRNTKECEIGHFEGALDPKTTTFHLFPQWVKEHAHMLENKRVLMYCTGGIRCEKASAFVRRAVPSVKKVQHLKGGIHKYLEAYNNDDTSKWQGKNFVFHADVDTKLGCEEDYCDLTNQESTASKANVVGKCLYCEAPYDKFDPHGVCTVCREPTLTCPACQEKVFEYHCKQHQHLKTCYFTDLNRFSAENLIQQLEELGTILVEVAVGKRFKAKRKTLHKQCEKIRQRLAEIEDGVNVHHSTNNQHRCRNCNDPACSGRCWGFHGLKRKELLEEMQHSDTVAASKHDESTLTRRRSGFSQTNDKKRTAKESNRDCIVKDFEHLQLSSLPSAHRNPETGIRIPPPCTRVLQTKMKGKWRGKPVIKVVKDEFMELSKSGVIDRVLEKGLLQINGNPVSIEDAGICLKTGDTISRVVHWHEPPVRVPVKIDVQRVRLPESAILEFDVPLDGDDLYIYVCNKPSSVPVHPAGPFLSNSLTMMVEAQEHLSPQSLHPCHRTDRVTSGLTICCTNPNVARIVQRSMCEHNVQKLYLARVHGKFFTTGDSVTSLDLGKVTDLVEVSFLKATECVRVNAPIETTDPANGIRQVTGNGKFSTSLFKLVSYDDVHDVSLLACRPITGRSHQLRVHLQLLGFPIVHDVQYGGKILHTSASSSLTEDAIRELVQSTTKPEQELRSLSLSTGEAKGAREACSLCFNISQNQPEDAARNFFTPAQLLESGHAIDLHALQYRIEIISRDKKGITDQDGGTYNKTVGVLELQVEKPDWADNLSIESVHWLQEDLK